MTPRMMDIFILYELLNTNELSAPCQAGSNPNKYVPPVATASTVPFFPSGHSQPDVQIWSDLEKMSLYINPVYMEKRPMRRMM
jgi:hypothetical protein